MTAALLAVVGLQREARLIATEGVTVVIGGGDSEGLARRLKAAVSLARPRAIASVGLGGALSVELKLGDWVIGDRIVGDTGVWDSDRALAAQIRPALSGAYTGAIASGTVIVASAADKADLRARTGALAVDMESHVAAAVAAEHGLPFMALRVISDAADRALPPAVMVSMKKDGGIDGLAVLWSLLNTPAQIPALIRTGREAEAAFRKLALLGRHDLLGRLGVGDADLGQLALDVV